VVDHKRSEAAPSRGRAVIELSRKMKHLLRHKSYDDEKIISELASFITGTQRRLIKDWVDGKVTHIRQLSRDHITEYFEKKHNIQFEHAWFFQPYDEMVSNIEGNANKSESKELLVELADGLSTFYEDEIENLCGKYKLFRCSFSDPDDIVTEVASISRNNNDVTRLVVDIYGHPTVWRNYVEDYRGILFKFGPMYSIVSSYKGKNKEGRIRYIIFPVLHADFNIHYGLVSAYSASHEEPVAARIVMQKLNGADSLLTEDDKKHVKRGNPDGEGPDLPTISPAIRKLIENRIDRKKAAVLLVDKEEVPKRPERT
jgi:hypothetical protein